MTLSPGSRLGSYEIVSLLGAGGMGEVYRARDTKLGREVAVKILPPEFVGDADRLARFEREAKTLAALNHPHVAQIHGLEQAGATAFLVMELVDGETLAGRLAAGPLPLDEARAIAGQIAAALEEAHERGIVHRDLKPANIALTRGGAVKLLDFGLAKAVAPEGSAAVSALVDSPTITSPAAATVAGVILGTAAYMAPEQARGKAVDRRADVWAFGCVLFEMLTGRPAFAGETVTDTLANVIHQEPAWNTLPPGTPAGIRRVLRRCLTKEPGRRLRDLGDARLDLEDASPEAPLPATQERTLARSLSQNILIFIAGGVIAGALVWAIRGRSAAPAPLTRWSVSLPADAAIDLGGPWPSLTISRDGTAIAYVGRTSRGRQLFLRRADDLTPRALSTTVDVWQAFFSPDGQWVGFIGADRLEKISVTGGQPIMLADAPNFASGVWADDGTIYLGGRAGLAKVTPDGKLTELLKPADNEGALTEPDLLPDGSLLFTIEPNDVTSFDDARIAVLTRTGAHHVLLEGGASARYSPTGHLVYVHGGQIMAVPFDVRRLAVSGRPAAVLNGGAFDPAAGAAYFALSRTGVLAYVPGGPMLKVRTLAWLDRRGTVAPIPVPKRFYAEPNISSDARQIALTFRAANDDVWTYDIDRQAFTRLTFPHGNNEVPIWTPDGRRIVYAVDRNGVRRLVWRPADGSGSEEPLTPAEYFQTPGSWSPDGKILAYTEDRPDSGSDLYVLPIDGDRKPVRFLATPRNERAPAFSPDGRWIAYMSDETGQYEVFVAPYPGPGARRQISTSGGILPVWRRDGREIVYKEGDRLVSVAVTPGEPPQFGRPVPLVTLPPYTEFAATTPDGNRFLVVYGDGQDRIARELQVVLNWSPN